MKGEIKISVRSYAKGLGVDEKAVRKAIAESKIKKGYDKKTKKIVASVADKEWGNIHKVKKPQAGRSKQKIIEQGVPLNDVKSNSVDTPDDLDSDNILTQIKLTTNLTYAEAARRREIIGAALDLKKLQESENVLVRRTDVEKTLFAFGDQLKKGMLNISARVIDDIMAAPNKIEAINILDMEIKSVLNLFSQMENLQIQSS